MAVTRKLLHCSSDNQWEDCMSNTTGPLKIMLVGMEIMVFGLFTLIMFCDQMCGVVNNVDKIDQWSKRRSAKSDVRDENDGHDGSMPTATSSRMENIRRVFGEEVTVLSWLLPTPAGLVGSQRLGSRDSNRWKQRGVLTV